MPSAAHEPVLTGVLVQQGNGYLSPRVQTFLCCSENGEGGSEDPYFYIAPARAVADAVQRGDMECPALWMDSGAVEAGSGLLQVVYRLGGGPLVSRLPLKPVRLQPVKQGTAPSRLAYRAFVSSSAYLQAYRIAAGLLPKLHTLHDHLASSGIPMAGQLQPQTYQQPGPMYSSDGLRAMPLHEGLLLERCDLGTGQLTKLKISINFHNACLELHDATPDATTVNKCLRTINSLADAVVTLEGRPGAGPLSVSPVKPAQRGSGAPAQSPAKPPLPSGLDSVRHGITLIQACSAAHLREGVALLSAAAGSAQLAASAVIMGALEALVSAAASVQPSAVMGMAELHALISVALGGLLDAAPPSSHAAARTITVVGAVLQKNCANPVLLCKLLAALLQRPGVRLEAIHQGLASAISTAYLRLAPGLEMEAQALLAAVSRAQNPDAASSPGPEMRQPAAIAGSESPAAPVPAAAAGAVGRALAASLKPAGKAATATAAAAGKRGRAAAPGAAFGSPQVLLVEALVPAPATGPHRASRQGLAMAAKPLPALPAVRTKSGTAMPAAEVPIGRAGYVAHMVSTFNALKVDSEQSPCGSPMAKPGGVLTKQDSNAWSPPKASSPARSVSALSNVSMSRVPRLLLPGFESPTGSVGGLTRSTRRAMGGSPAGRRSPSPTRFGSPVGRNNDDNVESSASAELAALASALGEALMAADLPAIIAHKRRANANSSSLDDEVPAELLQPPTPGVRKSLEAHKIFTTAKSLRSIESSPSNATGSVLTGDRAAAADRVRELAVEVEALKCLLLEALLASLPVVGSLGYPAPDPSPVLAMEVLSTLGQNLTYQQEQLMQLCLRALQQLSQPVAPTTDTPRHVLLALAACKLSQLVPQLGGQALGPAHAEAMSLLQLMAEYVAAAQSNAVVVAATLHCSAALQSLLGVLLAAPADVSDWNLGTWRLLHRLAALLAALCGRCHDAQAGRALLRTLLADQPTAAMLTAAASLVLLHPEVVGTPAFPYRAGSALLQREVLHLLVELAGLVGRQPAAAQAAQQGATELARVPSRMSSISSLIGGDESLPPSPSATPAGDLLLAPGPKGGKRLTRSQAFQILWPFLSPQSSFVRRILDHEPAGRGRDTVPPTPVTPITPASGDSVRLRHDVLQLLKVAFSAPGNPFVADKATTDFYIQFHFIQFLKLYHNPQRDHQALALCKKHMEVLLALASYKAPHSRKRFQQLSMMDFFVREVSLEFECSEPTATRARISRSGSTELRRRSSSFSLDGDTTTRRLSDRSGREGSLPPQPPSLGRSEAPPATTPPPVPALRLALKPALSSFSIPSQQQQQQPSGPPQPQQGGGRPALGLNIPRLNLPGTPPLCSPVEGQSPTAPQSSRLGRPPLPPSARTARLGTPRTSRLSRPVTEGPSPLGLAIPPLDAASGKLSRSPFAIHVHTGGLPPAAPENAQAASRVPVPKLGLGRAGLSLALPKMPLASPSSEGGQSQTPTPPPQAPGLTPDSAHDLDSDDSSDDEAGFSSRGASARQQLMPSTGLEVPAGFVWSGDLDEDVARLEAMEESLAGQEEEEVASPTIPAHRHSFDPAGAGAGSPSIPSLKERMAPGLLLTVPRLALPAKASPLAGSLGLAAAAGEAPEAGRLLAIPRLNLTSSMHSNLETRTASAELQVALDAERAKRKVGRTFLGDLEKGVLGKGKMQAVSLRPKNVQGAERDGAVSLEVSYEEERGKRLLYKDETLHLQVLQLIFVLLSAGDGQLDPVYIDQLPWQRKMLNIPHILHHHFNHPNTLPLLARLLPLLHAMGPPAMRLLRVLCGTFFRPEWYSGSRSWIGKGAYAQVYRYQLPEWTGEGTVVFKVLDLPKHFEDHCRQVDFFNEVSIMEALEDSWKAASSSSTTALGCCMHAAPSPRAVQLLDYGIDTTAEAMFLVMKDYRCSLRKWREAQPADPRGQLRLYLAIFQQVLSAVKALMEANVLHFDLKCDNVLLEPLPGVAEVDFWAPNDAAPPFRVVLADFGESKLFTGSLDGAMTVRNRGTECAKSPEMLLAANAYKKDAKTYDRRRREGAGAASDVWSLGCLLYELITGQFLFSVEPDWVRFFVHITDPRSGQLITPDKAQAVQHLPGVLGLLQYILVRDARLRPTLHDVQARVDSLLHGNRVRLPSYTPPAARGHTRGGASGALHGSHRPLQSPTMLHSPKLATPLPLVAPLPFAPCLLLAPLSAAQSAQSLQQRPLQRVVLLVGAIPAVPSPGSQPSTVRSSRMGRVLAPIGNMLGDGSGSAAASPRPQQGPELDGSSPRPCSEACSTQNSPGKSGQHGGGSGCSTQLRDGAPGNPLPSPPGQGGGAPSSAATSRLGTPRGSSSRFAEPSALAVAAAAKAAEGGRRPARPLFNSARVHAASATDVPSVFEAARGAELGGCSEWPGSSTGDARQQRLSQSSELRPPSRRASGTPSHSPRPPYQPLLPAGFSEGGACQRSAAEDAACQHVLSTPALAQCSAACAAAGVECKVVPCHGPGDGGRRDSTLPSVGPIPFHRWLKLAVPLLEGGGSSGSGGGAAACEAPQQGGSCPSVLLAPEPGCEAHMAALAVAHLMRRRGLSLYQAMVHAAAWGMDLHLGEPHLQGLQLWAEGLEA